MGYVKAEYCSSWMISWLVLVGNYVAWDTPNSAILRLYGYCICLKINKSLIIILLYQIIMWAFLNFNTAWKILDYVNFFVQYRNIFQEKTNAKTFPQLLVTCSLFLWSCKCPFIKQITMAFLSFLFAHLPPISPFHSFNCVIATKYS